MRAILSVSNKQGIEELAEQLVSLGVEVISTGGTLSALQAAGIEARSVSEITGFPEMMEGRVKTLHPSVHGGILARRSNPSDLEELRQQGIEPVDVIIVNLYPFAETIARRGVDLDTALENIDIGGPTLIRSAAKNFKDVLVITDPADYASVMGEWRTHSKVSFETRRMLAAKAFAHVSAYDSLVATYLDDDSNLFPETMTVPLRKVQELRYGENPHQRGALYRQVVPGRSGLAEKVNQLSGIELSYNNLLDADLAVSTVSDFLGPTVAILKHGNPCGLATNPDLVRAFELALMGDTLSAFGGIVGVNREITKDLAQAISKSHFDLIVAPSFEPQARDLLAKKRKLRLLEVGEMTGIWELPTDVSTLDFKHIDGGFLVQTPDNLAPDEVESRVVTRRQPTLEETTDLLFAWRACKHVRSNAIVLVKDLSLIGMGAGQPSRVDSVKIAAGKAGTRSDGSVLASDGLFPFADNIEEAAKAGVSAIIQPGGSIRDEEVIEAADKHGMAMILTGARHFRH